MGQSPKLPRRVYIDSTVVWADTQNNTTWTIDAGKIQKVLFRCSIKDKISGFFSVPGYVINGKNYFRKGKKPLPSYWQVWEIKEI